jgi:hypothetical protein
MKNPRACAVVHLSLALFLLASGGSISTIRAQQAAVPVPPATEYTNAPISTRDLQSAIDKAHLVVSGQIVEYAANKDVEKTVVVIAETYKGSVQPGGRISVLCICHHEAAPDPASRVGHRVILLLNEKLPDGAWQPVGADFEFFFHPALRTRILHTLGTDAGRQAKP